MPEKSDPIAHNGKQNVLVYRIWQNLLKFLQGVFSGLRHVQCRGKGPFKLFTKEIEFSKL